MVCIRFNNNMKTIHNHFNEIRIYIEHTIHSMNNYLEYSKHLESQNDFNICVKEKLNVLQKLQEVFSPKEIEAELSEVEVVEEEVLEEVVEQTELAEEPVKEEAPVEVAPVQTVEYATKLELEEMKKKFMDLFEAMQKESITEKEVPQELSKEEEVELAVEEIAHSPELEVEKKQNFHVPKANNESLESKIYNKLFN